MTARKGDYIVFQPALPMRGVTDFTKDEIIEMEFQPALPMRGVTIGIGSLKGIGEFQPALPMRGVTVHDDTMAVVIGISTRTPHAGSDGAGGGSSAPSPHFNPHSPCGE